MAAHSRILAWRRLWTEEPGGLQSTGSQSRTRLSTKHSARWAWGGGHLHTRDACPARLGLARLTLTGTEPEGEHGAVSAWGAL